MVSIGINLSVTDVDGAQRRYGFSEQNPVVKGVASEPGVKE